ncbi:uncharacterized protein LOC114731441 [Neltuma alba]|uniref:uncharacterized protein LOC114731441 n=1 Tax=Neltuma alba TaxID=207710 RepID=UPI0010A31497|nr:uncharacterized protein LOC114731441 [Prosopis alba]
MLQLLFAVAFSAVPLTIYVPPIRNFNLFVRTIEDFLRETTTYTIRAYPRVRFALSRIFNSLVRTTRVDSRFCNDHCWKISVVFTFQREISSMFFCNAAQFHVFLCRY